MKFRYLIFIIQGVLIGLQWAGIANMPMWLYLLPLIIYLALNVLLALAVLYSERP